MDSIPAPERRATVRVGDERAVLEVMLDYYRATLLLKCSGLDLEQLTRHPVPSSELTLLGLLRHMTAVEQWWFERIVSGLDPAWYYHDDEDEDVDFHGLTDTPLSHVVVNFDVACARSRELAGPLALDALTAIPSRDLVTNLRWVLVHMIEEYARHVGHADLMREMIDGTTGS